MNKVIIGTCLNDHCRVSIVNSKELVEEARVMHNMYPTSLAALGRTASITALMAIQLKGKDEHITTTINGGGPIGTIMVVASSDGKVKGFVGDNNIYLKYNDSNKLAVGMAVGTDGYLKVIKDLNMKEAFTSQVKLQTGEIGEDFAYYFSVSEQIPSIVSVGVLVDVDYTCKSAGAMIIELLPGHSEEDINYLENLAKNLKPISNVLALNPNPLDYINSLFTDFKCLEEKEIKLECDCSKERFKRNLLTLPKKDLLELGESDFEVECEFCDKKYKFTTDDIKDLLKYVKDR